MDQHELVSKIKEMFLELGRSPTRAEFTAQVPAYRLEKAFGTFAALQQAAGIEPHRKPKIDNSIFNKSIEGHLESYEPKTYTAPVYSVTWASISDMHLPFWCERVVNRFYKYIEENKPEFVILNGDAWDMYSHSKFPRSHNIFTPREERALCLKMNAEFWARIKKIHVEAKCFQLLGNHDLRPLKRILEAVPAAEDWAEEMMRRDFTFDGVTTIFDPRQELMINPDTAAFHGNRSQLGAHRDYTLLNCINAHTHRGGTVFKQLRYTVLFEVNSGFAGDPEAKGLTYTPQRISDSTPGFSAGDAWGPRFIPA